MKDSSQLNNHDDINTLDDYYEDLTSLYDESEDIDKVYRIIDSYDYTLPELIEELPKDKIELIWKRNREIDWAKVPKFTKVQVRNSEYEQWRNCYFVGVETIEGINRMIITFRDEFTYSGRINGIAWKHIRFYDETDIEDSWHK